MIRFTVGARSIRELRKVTTVTVRKMVEMPMENWRFFLRRSFITKMKLAITIATRDSEFYSCWALASISEAKTF